MTTNVTAPKMRKKLTLPRKLEVSVAGGVDVGKKAEAWFSKPLSVGVADDNGLVVSDPTVSRYHVELHLVEGGVQVTDLGSLNGTYVGDVLLERAVLPAGSRISLGDTVLELGDAALVPEPPGETPEMLGFVAKSEAMQEVARTVALAAGSAGAVLVQGETGTGKELVARAIHDLSDRADKPFEVVDCGSLPATLIAAELFGHEKGAFTGADQRRAGAFERADGGTIFLDEIGDLPQQMQPALLGVLERRSFRRVGGSKDVPVDVKVVSATHRDLRTAVNEGSFRPDLYFRLAVVRVAIPPLRERPEDIEPLVRHFVARATGDPSADPFSPSALELLRTNYWRGNVRELRNVVEAALALGELRTAPTTEPLPVDVEGGDRIVPYKQARASVVGSFERNYLSHLIEACEGNASEAARRAQMDRPYLLSLLKKHRLR